MPKLTKNGHTVETSLPSEVVQLRAEGYTEAPAPKQDAHAPAPKSSK